MQSFSLKTISLTKKYNKQSVVNDVSIEIKSGGIYGLIGKNGAGKTTLIRMLAGLIFPDYGKIEINGVSDEAGLSVCRKQMSFIVETPYFIPQMTAEQNMNIQCIQKGIKDKTRIEQMLKLVSLNDTHKKKVSNFSLGMKQRLGIAISMLSKPNFLVLDEPTNGLDPEGIIQMRNLITRLNKNYGTTILISSHILAELHNIATDYIIMHNGEVKEQFSSEEFELKGCTLEEYFMRLIGIGGDYNE